MKLGIHSAYGAACDVAWINATVASATISLPPERVVHAVYQREVSSETAHTIYTARKEYTRWEALSPFYEWSIPLFRADFLYDTSKSVEVGPNLPSSEGDRERHDFVRLCQKQTGTTL